MCCRECVQFQEECFLKNVKVVPIISISRESKITGSHTFYKLKVNDDKIQSLNVQIALHVNEDSKDNLNTACSMCPPFVTCNVTTKASARKWRIVRVDAKHAILQTRPATRIVYVRPPRESQHQKNF